MKSFHYKKRERLGPVAQKMILLLGTGLALSLTTRPDYYFKVIKSAEKDWQKINQKSLREAIKRLYQSNLIDYKENNDGTVTLTLDEKGRKRFLRYNLENIKIKKPIRWDGLWRIVMFDVPESKKKARDALSSKLKRLGLKPLQKSVFVSPYDCREEIEFIAEVFEVKPYVRYLLAKEVDVSLDLKHRFHMI